MRFGFQKGMKTVKKIIAILLVMLFIFGCVATVSAGNDEKAQTRTTVTFSSVGDGGRTPGVTKTVENASASVKPTGYTVSATKWYGRIRRTTGTVEWVSDYSSYFIMNAYNNISYTSGKGKAGYTYVAYLYHDGTGTGATLSGRWDPS